MANTLQSLLCPLATLGCSERKSCTCKFPKQPINHNSSTKTINQFWEKPAGGPGQIMPESRGLLAKLSNGIKVKSRDKKFKSSCSPFVALNIGHHLLGWTAEYNNSRAAAAALRSSSPAAAPLSTQTCSKNTTLGFFNGLSRGLSDIQQPRTPSTDRKERCRVPHATLKHGHGAQVGLASPSSLYHF